MEEEPRSEGVKEESGRSSKKLEEITARPSRLHHHHQPHLRHKHEAEEPFRPREVSLGELWRRDPQPDV
ncbi:hypothetical protein E2C01_039613 [Portunus trituberculatus]|uniref:Uncharacterized protein n=1 Tax=Portunus trituberculatus TaxID=210409 RepID=A0A5B7FK88_PORTR|nr:hypothetical protein [Portunus trituberculatus]